MALGVTPETCDPLKFVADTGTCETQHCSLRGAVSLRCNTIKLWADAIDVQFDAGGVFQVARAKGNITLVEGTTVITCDALTLGADRIIGNIFNAEVLIKNHPSPVDVNGIPTGTNASIFHGNIERKNKETLHLNDADYTLCDCGPKRPPSWLLKSKEINAVLGQRATLWWPMLYISPMGFGPIPITPPLAPLSLPLRNRALGFLAPMVALYGPYPMIDLPFFIPLGRSFDITIRPGLRTDWMPKHKLRPSKWGAPRLGGRLRYTPSPWVTGEIDAQWTWDRKLFVARQRERELRLLGVGTDKIQDDVERLKRQNLPHRVQLSLKQSVRLGDNIHWVTDAGWLSDDRIPQDFGFALSQQVINYVPSRSQVNLRFDPLMASIGFDYFQSIGNDPNTYSNTLGKELDVAHRAPALRLSLIPVAPFAEAVPAMVIDGDAHWVRYGNVSGAKAEALWVGATDIGVGWLRTLGPVHVATRASGHVAAGMNNGGESTEGFLFAMLDAKATSLLAKKYPKDLTHTLKPMVRYRSIVGRHRLGKVKPEDDAIDPRLRPKVFYHLETSVKQHILQRGREVLGLDVALPFDLVKAKILPLRLKIDWSLGQWTTGHGFIELDLRAHRAKVPAVGGSVQVNLGELSFGGTYSRLSRAAEALSRGYYHFVGSGDTARPDDWVHSLQPTVSIKTKQWTVGYGTLILLKLPGQETVPLTTKPVRPYAATHLMRIGYTSPCACWGVGASASIPGFGTAQEISQAIRWQIQLSVGAYQVGSRSWE